MTRDRIGVLLCLASAAAFSTSTVFGRIALEAGAGVVTILALRYAGAALIFAALLRATDQRLPGRGALVGVLALGAAALSAQSLLFYSALARLDAALVTLLLYAFPAMVAVGAVALGREPPSRRKAVAVLVATAGVVLVLAGDLDLRADSLGVGLALGAALCYAAYLLVSHRLLAGMPALVVSTLVSTGAALALWSVGLLTGAIDLQLPPVGWGAIVGTILISTVLAISTALGGVARVGPTVASVLATVEVPLAVTWAMLLLGERLQPLQLVGGVLVVGAVLLLQARISWRLKPPPPVPAPLVAVRRARPAADR